MNPPWPVFSIRERVRPVGTERTAAGSAAGSMLRRPLRFAVPAAADLWILAALLAPAAWFFREALLRGRVFYKRDIHLLWYGQTETFVRAVKDGSWPTWNPYVGFGQPMWANPDAQVAYPFTWASVLLAPWTQYTFFAVLHLWWAAVGTYVLGRRLTLSRGAALAGALAWASSGPLLSTVDTWHHFASASWMPWVIVAADATARTRRWSWALGWGAAAGMQLLAGSADMTVMTGLVAAAHVILHVDWRRPWPQREAIARAGLAAVVAAGLSAALWLPTLDVVRRSTRTGLLEGMRTYWSVHPLTVLDVVIPGLSTFPMNPALWGALHDGREPFLQSLYLGVGVFGLAVAALAGPPRPMKALLAGLAVAALLFALGRHAPFYGIALRVLPSLAIFRYPVKAMVLVAFASSVLAGMGLDAWREQSSTRSHALVIAVLGAVAAAEAVLLGLVTWRPSLLGPLVGTPPAGVALRDVLSEPRLHLTFGLVVALAAVALAVARRARPQPTAGLIALLAVADLFAFHRGVMPFAPRPLVAHRPEVVDVLRDRPSPRIYVYDYSPAAVANSALPVPNPHLRVRMIPGWSESAARAFGMQLALTPQTASRWGISSGYDLDLRGLLPPEQSSMSLFLRRLEGTPAHDRLLRMASITHVVALHARGFEGQVPAAVQPSLFEEPIRVFEVPDPLPAAYVVSGVRLADGTAAYGALVDPEFHPEREVLLPAGRPIAAGVGTAGDAQIVERRADRVVIRARSAGEGYLVLTDSYEAGWKATVDGAPVDVLKANLIFRAVRLGPGDHRVEFVYRPWSVRAGVSVSLASAIALLVVAMRRGFGPV